MKPYNIVLAAYLLSVLPVTAQPTLDFKQLPKEVGDHALKVREFNPDQPRHPAGVSEGGQFARAGKPSTPRAAKGKPSTPRAAKPAAPSAPKVPPVTDAFRGQVRRAMGLIPPKAQASLDKYGVKIESGAVMSDIFPEVRGRKLPPGVGTVEGMTVDTMEAMYNWDTKKAGIAQSTVWPDGTVVLNNSVEASVLHEVGHALDQTLGADIKLKRFSDLQEFIDAYNKDVANLPAETKKALAYFLQEGTRGRSETFAELFALNAGNVGTTPWDLRPYFPTLNKGIEGVVGILGWLGCGARAAAELAALGHTCRHARLIRIVALDPLEQLGEVAQRVHKPDDAKVAQQLTGAAIMKDTPECKQRSKKIKEVAKKMKWFFNMDRNDVVQLVSRIEGNNFIGDARREVKPGESFFGVSYASLRVAKFGTVEVDVKGNGTLHPAR